MIKKLFKNMAVSGAIIAGFVAIVIVVGVLSRLISSVIPDFGPLGDLIVTAVSAILVSGVIMTTVDWYINREAA
jgi:hypothetical protein